MAIRKISGLLAGTAALLAIMLQPAVANGTTDLVLPSPVELTSIITESTGIGADPSNTDALIGQGFDSVRAIVRGKCLDTSPPLTTILGDPTLANGQKVDFSLDAATSFKELRSKLDISASASFGVGIYSGSGSYHLFQENNVSSLSSFLIVRVKVLNLTETISERRLSDPAKSRLSNMRDFKAFCGDSVIISRQSGGDFLALVRFNSHSSEDKRSVDAKIGGAVGNFGSASGSFSQNLSALAQYSDLSITILKAGNATALPDIARLRDYALNFPPTVARNGGHPWAFSVITTDYDTVDDFVGEGNFDSSIYNDFMDNLASERDWALVQRNDIRRAIADIDNSPGLDLSRLNSDLQALEDYLVHLSAKARVCSSSSDADHIATKCSGARPRPNLGGPNAGLSPFVAALNRAERQFAARGTIANAIAPIQLLASIDGSAEPARERYRAAILLARAYLWQAGKFETPFQAPNRPPIETGAINNARAALVRARSAVGSGANTCEYQYLQAIVDFTGIPFYQGNPAFLQQATAVRERLSGASTLSTWDGKPCQEYDSNGIARHSATINDMLSRYYLDVAHDFSRAIQASAAAEQQWRDAVGAAPRNPANQLWFVYFHLNAPVPPPSMPNNKAICDVLKAFIRTPTTTSETGLEPVFGEYRERARQIYLGNSMCWRDSGNL